MLDIIKAKEHVDIIHSKREEVSKLLILKSDNIKNNTISSISSLDMLLMFQLYDQIFLQNWFKDSFKGKMQFSISKRLAKSAAITICPKNIDRIKPEELVVEIRIGIDFFFHYGLIEGIKTVCGIDTNNSLEALQLVFEHELCHVIEFIYFKKSNCKASRFKTIAGNLFGHTDSYHKLPTYKQIANEKLGIKIGDTVSFILSGSSHMGIIYNINKRATIMVRDNNGQLVDNYGHRYSKYYVPLKYIKKYTID